MCHLSGARPLPFFHERQGVAAGSHGLSADGRQPAVFVVLCFGSHAIWASAAIGCGRGPPWKRPVLGRLLLENRNSVDQRPKAAAQLIAIQQARRNRPKKNFCVFPAGVA